MTAQCQ